MCDVSIRLSLLGAIRFAAILFATSIVVMIIVDLLTRMPIHNPLETESADTLRIVAIVVIAATVVLAAGLYGLGRAFTVTVTFEHIASRTETGKKVSIDLNSVQSIEFENPPGVSYPRIRSDTESADILALLLAPPVALVAVQNRFEIRNVRRLVGDQHVAPGCNGKDRAREYLTSGFGAPSACLDSRYTFS